jgi:hypothetical protein
MSIDSISANNAAYTTATTNNNLPGGQLGQDFQSLAKALSSGDLGSAKTAFASIQTDIQNGPGGSASASTSSSSSSGSSSSTNPLQALAAALKSGNLQDAQQAFAALQQSGKGHHHHHHKESGTASANSTDSSNSANGTGSGNGIQSDFKALATALSSGSLSDAQTAFSTLQSDFKNNPPPAPPDPSGMSGQNLDTYAT